MRGFFDRLTQRTVEGVSIVVCPLFGGGVTPRAVDANCNLTGIYREWFGLGGKVYSFFVDDVAISPLHNTTLFFWHRFG